MAASRSQTRQDCVEKISKLFLYFERARMTIAPELRASYGADGRNPAQVLYQIIEELPANAEFDQICVAFTDHLAGLCHDKIEKTDLRHIRLAFWAEMEDNLLPTHLGEVEDDSPAWKHKVCAIWANKAQ